MLFDVVKVLYSNDIEQNHYIQYSKRDGKGEVMREERKQFFWFIDKILTDELDKMLENGDEISVSGLARRCNVTRATIYNHSAVYERVKQYRDEQIRLKYKRK